MASGNRLHPIPKPDGLPFVGNIFTVDSQAPLQNLMQIGRDIGPIYWMDFLGKPSILVWGADLVAELCDEKRFDKTVRGPLRRLRAIGGDGLFTGDTTAPNWGKAHNILMPTFSQAAMKKYLPMMVDIAEQMMKKWERLNSDDEIDVSHDMVGLALDTIGLCGFDYRFNSFYTEDFHPYINAMNRTLELSMLQRGLPFEDLAMRERFAQYKKDVPYMNALVDDIIRERRKTGGDQNDLLNYMLAGTDPVTGEGLSDENIRYQINTFLIAGHETTSGLLSFTLYYLLKHPAVLAKARAEVDRVLGHDISLPPSYAQIGELEYVRAVLSEALRLWPTAPAFSVTPFKDEIIGGKYPIPKGSFTSVLVPMLHRDTSVWGREPDAFNPDNFMGEAEISRPPHAYKPFGNGQRACIGRQFAMQEAVLVVGMILQRFDLYNHNNYDLEIKETLSLKPHNFKIKAKLRQDVVRGTGVTQDIQTETNRHVATTQRPYHGTKFTVLFGSNLGMAEGLARDMAQKAEQNGFDVSLIPLDAAVDALPKGGAVAIVTSSYNGAPPNNAAKFMDWVENLSPGALDGVTYTVFGCGSRDWAATFQAVPRRIDNALSKAGAKAVLARGEGDAREDMDGQFHAWLEPVWPLLGAHFDIDVDFKTEMDVEPIYTIENAPSVSANPVIAKAGAVEVAIVANRELQSSTSARSTRHIEIALPEGMDYVPGDHVCVVPVNPPELVDRALKRFGYKDTDHIRIYSRSEMRSPFPSGSTFSVKHLAETTGELQAVATRSDVAMLARYAECPHTKSKLEALAAPERGGEDLYRSEIFLKRKSVLDILEEFPACELPHAVFIEMIPVMAPRYYSISSSPEQDPQTCSMTVAVVEGPARSGHGQYKGVCSTYLKQAMPGERIHIALSQPATPFRLPEDPSQPLIMIGPGTGLAPFRGFIQSRRAFKAAGHSLGPAMLFFGCRHPDEDFIYKHELKQAHADGIIELHTAFSRLNDTRVYVQDVLRQQAPKVWKLIQDGANIYVCGDGSAMEPDVKRAITTLYASETDKSFDEAEAWMQNMARTGCYVLDVWAGS